MPFYLKMKEIKPLRIIDLSTFTFNIHINNSSRIVVFHVYTLKMWIERRKTPVPWMFYFEDRNRKCFKSVWLNVQLRCFFWCGVEDCVPVCVWSSVSVDCRFGEKREESGSRWVLIDPLKKVVVVYCTSFSLFYIRCKVRLETVDSTSTGCFTSDASSIVPT